MLDAPLQNKSQSPRPGEQETFAGGGGESDQAASGFLVSPGPDAADGVRRGGQRRPIPPKLYRIGELVTYSGVSRQTIHNYTVMGLLNPTRYTDGRHRLYDETVFERLDRIAEMRLGNKSIQDIRDFFSRLDREKQAEAAAPR